MIQIIAALLLILWLVGIVSSVTLGGFIHVLLVIAVVMFLVRIIQGRSLWFFRLHKMNAQKPGQFSRRTISGK
jgi:Family of unknown function (DUF5670)